MDARFGIGVGKRHQRHGIGYISPFEAQSANTNSPGMHHQQRDSGGMNASGSSMRDSDLRVTTNDATPSSTKTPSSAKSLGSIIGGLFGRKSGTDSNASTPSSVGTPQSVGGENRRRSISIGKIPRVSSTQSFTSPGSSSSSSSPIERHYEDCIAYLRDPLIHLIPEHELHKTEHVALSRDLSQGLYRYIQFRLEMIAFYRMLSSNQGRIPNFRSYCLVLRNFQQKYLTRGGSSGNVSSTAHQGGLDVHAYLNRLFFNARMELDLVLNLMEEADLVGRLHYVPATMKLFQIDKTFERWIKRYNSPPEWEMRGGSNGSLLGSSHDIGSAHHHGNDSRTTSKLLKRVSTTKGGLHSLIKDKLGGSAGNIASTLVNGIPNTNSSISLPPDDDSSESSDSRHHSAGMGSPPDSHTPPNFVPIAHPIATATNSSAHHHHHSSHHKKTTLLESTNLFKWLKLTYKFCLSKYSWYFFDVLKQKPNSGHTFHHFLKDRAVVSYSEWMSNFCKQLSPEFACLIYNAQDDEGHAPPVTEKGYSMRHMCARKLETLAGMRQWPCVYIYPTDADKATLVRRHWPSLLSLIADKDEAIAAKLNPLSFIDEKAGTTYFFSRVDERMYLCFVYNQLVESKSKAYKLNAEFIYQMNLFMRFSKLFSFLTAG